MGKTLGCLAGLAGLIIGTLIEGFVLVKLWTWFIVPIFGVEGLSIPAALGISLLAHMLTVQYNGDNAKKEYDEWYEPIVAVVVYNLSLPLYAWCMGWVIHLFMP